MSLVELARFPTRVEADLARLALANEGIAAFLMDDGMNNVFGGGGLVAVRLMVDDSEADEAAAILREGD
ncbi:DUF2007 domain-containing protein [Sphingomicrobium nitratireducens]|uniref:putative signal transducing protein n=1 Tax=Sphingomicrobium nitratireducens TaxID=2964666 RepID=UPI002240C7BB|nr:DUF2007 domain-containing protein [Sphingomicrobium nitratireducens]